MNPCTIEFIKLSANATIPTRGSIHSAGLDLYSAYDYSVEPQSRTLVKTDLRVNLPVGCYGRIAPRSGLAYHHFIEIGAGVIDYDYTGNLCVLIFNFGDTTFEINRGDRIAQLICEKIEHPLIIETSKFTNTIRSNRGFGSSGR